MMTEGMEKEERGRLPRREIPEEPGNYTYILQCGDGTLYTGWTTDLRRRMHAHNDTKAGAKYTHAKRPVELVWYENSGTKQEAMQKEYRIKRLTRAEKLRLIGSGERDEG